jgi:sRNA-binding carbon storage regulator CsrA
MLVLTRKTGEVLELYYEDKLVARIEVKSCRPDRTQLAIQAPQELKILRGELQPSDPIINQKGNESER